MRGKLEEMSRRLEVLEEQASDPQVMKDPARSRTLFKELGSLRKVVSCWRSTEKLLDEISDNADLIRSGEDEELTALAREELPGLEAAYCSRIEEIETLLLVDDELYDRNAILEIRAGTGGDEAALFARDLSRMYARFCEREGWKMKQVSVTETGLGGFKEAVFSVTGQDVFRFLRFESGGHRVQRVPSTEAQGRIHTSAATVAVLPEAEEVDVLLDPKDLDIQTTTSSGPGGQHVNKTQSAVRITHGPTGLVVFCQEERSQHKNKAKALHLLRARLFDLEQREQQEQRAKERRSQVGTGDRNMRIRTYNFPQNRVTDHRTHASYSLEKVIDGDLKSIWEELSRKEREDKLTEL
ncbi:MAG: peptide chain release factor 1 [Planctomycetota bacterium]